LREGVVEQGLEAGEGVGRRHGRKAETEDEGLRALFFRHGGHGARTQRARRGDGSDVEKESLKAVLGHNAKPGRSEA
jgi:hypothetical protein